MPIRHRIAVFLLLALAAIGARAAPHLYRFDRVHSQILFDVSHNGYSSAMGQLHIAAGWLRFDESDWSTAATELDIDLAGVDMGDADWSRTVRGNGLLDTAHHPYAHFTSTGVRRTGPDRGVLEGRLTLRGISQPVLIAFRLNRIGLTLFGLHTVAGFSGSSTLDRTAFGVTRNTDSIGRMVNVRLEIEALRDADAQRQYKQWAAHHAAAQ